MVQRNPTNSSGLAEKVCMGSIPACISPYYTILTQRSRFARRRRVSPSGTGHWRGRRQGGAGDATTVTGVPRMFGAVAGPRGACRNVTTHPVGV